MFVGKGDLAGIETTTDVANVIRQFLCRQSGAVKIKKAVARIVLSFQAYMDVAGRLVEQ